MSNRYATVDSSMDLNIIGLDLIDHATALRGHCEHQLGAEVNQPSLCQACHQGFQARLQKTFAWDETAQAMGNPIIIESGWIGDWANPKIPVDWKNMIWATIKATPNLRWLLLSNTDEDLSASLPDDWGNGYDNAALGVRVSNRQHVMGRFDQLRRIPAQLRFVEFGVPEESLGKFNTKGFEFYRFDIPDSYHLKNEQRCWLQKIEKQF